MRHFRFLIAAFVLLISTSAMANYDFDFEIRKGSISSEIEKMLKQSELTIDENFTVTVIFRVTDEKKIEIQKVSSPSEEVNEFLMKRLDKQKLHGPSWDSKKVYELPVRVHSRR